MKLKTYLWLVLTASLSAPSLWADSKISWDKTDQYTDIEAAEENQKKFEDRFFKSLEKHLDGLAKSLPKGQKLWIKMTDVDLAGRVLPAQPLGSVSPRDIRVVKHFYFPELEFSYHLSDADGKVLKSGDAKIKDMSFSDRLRTRSQKRDAFDYEKRLLSDWYKETFPQQVAKN